MTTIKIASKFLTKSQATKAASKQKQLLKTQGKNKSHRVEVLFAYTLWRTNKWFNQKKFGLKNPTDQDYIVIITEIKQVNTVSKNNKTIQENAVSQTRSSAKITSTENLKVKHAPVNKVQKVVAQPTALFLQMRIALPFYYRLPKTCCYNQIA